MVWPEFRKLRRALAGTKNRGNQRKKSKEKKGGVVGEVGVQHHPGWGETNNVEEDLAAKVVCSDKGVKLLLLKDGSWSSDDNTNNDRHDSHPLIKVELERQVAELQMQLAEERHNANREHAQEARDGLRLDLEREKLLRRQAESRLEEAQVESQNCKACLTTLQQDFCKMEEMAMQLKCQVDRLQGEKSSLSLAYQSQLHKYRSCVASLEKDNFLLLNELKSLEAMHSKGGLESWSSRLLLERVHLLEQENSSLVLENEQQRMQYEWCLDDVGRQVVRALVAQKGLREECLQLQKRVRELEGQNLALSTTLLAQDQPLLEVDAFRAQNKKVTFEAQFHGISPSSLAGQSERSTDSLASFCSDFSLRSDIGSFEQYQLGQRGGCARMSSPPHHWLTSSHRSSWAGFLRPPSSLRHPPSSPLHDDATAARKLEIWKSMLWSERSSLSDHLDAVETPGDDSGPSPWSSPLSGIPPRPTTLNIVPHAMGDPSSRNSHLFPALEKRAQDLAPNAPGNVYEEVNPPRFPQTHADSPEDEANTNTVVRRVSVASVPALEALIAASPIPIPPVLPDIPKPAGLAPPLGVPEESPLSAGGGKDEGYSTMSSDVQCDTATTTTTAASCQLPGSSGSSGGDGGVMAVSVDSGLGEFRRCATSCVRQSSVGTAEEGEESCAIIFESFSDLKDVKSIREVYVPSVEQHRISSFCEPRSCDASDFPMNCHPKRCSLDSVSYDKIIKLLTPQGFTRNGSTRSDMSGRRETLVEIPLQKTSTDDVECHAETTITPAEPDRNDTNILTLEKRAESPLCQASPTIDRHRFGTRGRSLSDSNLVDRRKRSEGDTATHSSVVDLPTLLEQSGPLIGCNNLKEIEGSVCSVRSSNSGQEGKAAAERLLRLKNKGVLGGQDEEKTQNRNLVEQWLQMPATPHKFQKGYTYDEEEVGNWSLDLSLEDLSQSQWEDPWDDDTKKQTVAEDLWNAPLFNQEGHENSAQPPLTTESKELEEDEERDQSVAFEGAGSSEKEGQAADALLQAEVTEFNSDFYRLCRIGSVRSLAETANDNRAKDAKARLHEGKRAVKKERTRIPVCVAAKDRRPKPTVKRVAQEEGEREEDFEGLSVADKISRLTALLEGEEHSGGRRRPPRSRIPGACSPEKRHQRRAQVAGRRQKEGCGTSWVHFEADIDLSDPKARANILDSMMASSSSSSSEGEADGDEDQVVEHQHHQRLHALHRFRRHRKRAADPDALINLPPRLRASIVDRHDFFYRFGEKEREAVACFDFLDDLSTSPSDAEAASSSSVASQQNQQLRRRHRISLSDSCAESYSSSTHSLNRIS